MPPDGGPEGDTVFRRADIADLATVERITAAAYAPYDAVLGYPPVPVTEDYRPRLARGEVWLQDSATPAALAVLEIHPDHLMIFSLAILPEHQGRGLGQRLLQFAEERAAAEGKAEIRLYTNAKMERNIGIYLRAGYRETGRRPNPRRPAFTIVDMVKQLGGDMPPPQT
jgi:ribosomal protein S18 acetylase RimI-like enzyme